MQEQFEEAATESIDNLDVSGIASYEDRESAIGSWLEEMNKIEEFLGRPVDSWQRMKLEDDLGTMRQLHDQQMQEMREEGSLIRSAASSGNTSSPSRPSNRFGSAGSGFSNRDLGNMFSSLKK